MYYMSAKRRRVIEEVPGFILMFWVVYVRDYEYRRMLCMGLALLLKTGLVNVMIE